MLHSVDGQLWLKKADCAVADTLIQQLRDSMHRWYEISSQEPEPSQNYIQTMRVAHDNAVMAGAHQIEFIHLLNAVLMTDNMLMEWLKAVDYKLLPVSMPTLTPVLDEFCRDVTALAQKGGRLLSGVRLRLQMLLKSLCDMVRIVFYF